MKRHGQLFEPIAATENLWGAWRDFRRGKRRRPSVRAFEWQADRRVVGLHRALLAGDYRPEPYRGLLICEPKRRLVAAAAVRDRVVHHAVHRVLAPLLDPGLIDTTYACLPGRGSHRALLAFLGALRRYPYVLLLDIRHYFLGIDHRILLELMARRLEDPRLLALLGVIVESGEGLYHQPGLQDFLGLAPDFPPPACGLPIGNLTSQWWGNHYLSGLDHLVKRDLKLPHYQRYMDDLTLFADSRPALAAAREAIAEWLWHERRLHLKRPKAEPRSTARCFTYLGYRVSRAGLHPTHAMLGRLRRRIAHHILHGDIEAIERSLASYRGVLWRQFC